MHSCSRAVRCCSPCSGRRESPSVSASEIPNVLILVKQRFAAVAHLQANGQVEVTNRIIVNGLKKRLDEIGGSWVDELPSVLWSYRTSPKESTGETPFSLTYGSEAVIPAEIGLETLRIKEFDPEKNDAAHGANLDDLFERREIAHMRMERSKNRIKKRYDKGIRVWQFQVGDLVLRQDDTLKATGKLDPNWEGPYKVVRCFAGEAHELVDMDGRMLPRAWNICHLRRYYA